MRACSFMSGSVLHVSRCAQRPEEGNRKPGTGVAEDWSSLLWVLGTTPRSPARTVSTLSHHLSSLQIALLFDLRMSWYSRGDG